MDNGRSDSPHAITVAILAMGGEGGGVLADWIVDIAEHAGFHAQTTSVPGVAQRTGATIYYIEILAPDEETIGRPTTEIARERPHGRQPVLGLMPTPGAVDVVIASELMEAGRAVQRGLVTADRTTLIMSTHRVYSMTEKTAMGDGRVDSGKLIAGATDAARECIGADFSKMAEDNGSVISAVLFGVLAACERLPFDRNAFELAIERAGVGVRTSKIAFDAGYKAAVAQRRETAPVAVLPASAGGSVLAAVPGSDMRAPADSGLNSVAISRAGRAPVGPDARGVSHAALGADAPADASTPAGTAAGTAKRVAVGPRLQSLADRVNSHYPESTRPTVLEGLKRTAEYQDIAYAADYLDRLEAIRSVDAHSNDERHRLLDDSARHLALWMTYEDTIRVADLKTRRGRFARVASEVRLKDDQLLEVNEFMHPRIEEIADSLPAPIGRWVMKSRLAKGLVGPFTRKGRKIRTSSLSGFLLLYFIASLRTMRRSSLRYHTERARIAAWLACIVDASRTDYALACEVAACQRLVKGYGDTHARGLRSFETMMESLPWLRTSSQPAQGLRRLRDAALADDTGATLQTAIATLKGA